MVMLRDSLGVTTHPSLWPQRGSTRTPTWRESSTHSSLSLIPILSGAGGTGLLEMKSLEYRDDSALCWSIVVG